MDTTNTTTAAAPAAAIPAAPSQASTIVGLLYTLGVAAAAIFVKNPAHIQTAGAIVSVLQAELPSLTSLL